jgi:hypothetical protein
LPKVVNTLSAFIHVNSLAYDVNPNVGDLNFASNGLYLPGNPASATARANIDYTPD